MNEREKWIQVALDNIRLPENTGDTNKSFAVVDYVRNVLDEEVTYLEVREVIEKQKN